jgi:hypothetical protein
MLFMLIIRTSSVPRLAVRRTAALTIEPHTLVVQPTLGGPRLWTSKGAEGRDHRTTSLGLTCHLHCTRRIQSIPIRRASRSINLLPALLTQQGTAPLEGISLQITIKVLCQ